MAEFDLDAIEARQRTARDAMTEDWQDNNAVIDAVSSSMYDVPALIAEVRRLYAAVDAALTRLHAIDYYGDPNVDGVVADLINDLSTRKNEWSQR